MTDNYDDIKHSTFDDLHPMSMHDRAVWFSCFEALNGYDDVVADTARSIAWYLKS